MHSSFPTGLAGCFFARCIFSILSYDQSFRGRCCRYYYNFFSL